MPVYVCFSKMTGGVLSPCVDQPNGRLRRDGAADAIFQETSETLPQWLV